MARFKNRSTGRKKSKNRSKTKTYSNLNLNLSYREIMDAMFINKFDNADIGDTISGFMCNYIVSKCPKCTNKTAVPTIRYGGLFSNPIIDGDNFNYAISDHCDRCQTSLFTDSICYICHYTFRAFKYNQRYNPVFIVLPIIKPIKPPIVCIETKCINKFAVLMSSTGSQVITSSYMRMSIPDNCVQLISDYIKQSIIDTWKSNEQFCKESW
jgi:hypothetical protein